jgi:hypothetical protein
LGLDRAFFPSNFMRKNLLRPPLLSYFSCPEPGRGAAASAR